MIILHILFILLKIIGILILALLGILLLAVLIVLFVPVRYEGEVGVKNSLASVRARGTVSWLFHLIRGRFQYKNGKLHYELRILWKKIGNGAVKEEPVKSESVEDADSAIPEEAVHLKATEIKSIDSFDNPQKSVDSDELIQSDDLDELEKSTESGKENATETLERSEDSVQPVEKNISEGLEKTEKQDDSEVGKTEINESAELESAKNAESATKEKTQAESVESIRLVKQNPDIEITEDRKSTKKDKDSDLEGKIRKTEKKNRKDKKEKSSEQKSAEKKEKKKRIRERISGIRKKIKYTFRKICDTIEQISDLKEWAEEFLTNEDHRRAFSKALKSLKKLLISLKPGSLKGKVRYGFENPYYTGKVLAGLSVLYPWYGEDFEICPEFEQACIVGRVSVKGKIRASYFARAALGLLLNKSVRRTYKDVKNILDAK